ncbi:MarR family winged helix-turn-helix transcriptional regulator [Nocardioides terrae]|nr:MarR family transcriptional regulator [Nocardioides terrae]
MREDEREEETTAELLMAVARRLRRGFAAALEDYAVTPSQARALRTVVEEPGIRLSVLAERLGIAPRSATEVVDALEARGLVAREPDPADRRAMRVTATGEGLRLQRLVHESRHRELDGFADGLTVRDRAELDRILRLLLTGR